MTSSKVFTPRPYQDLIINHEIDTLRCNIWAGMGMGKTVATLTTLEDLFMAGAETQPALVLAPLRVAASTWPDEAVKWGHLRNIEVQPIVGNAKARAAALANSNASVFTINYDNLVWLVEELGGRWPFGTVIPDESTRLKSFRLRGGGKRAAALGKVAHKHTRRWMNLTGTPAPNGLVDLWGQAWFVDQGQRLGRTYGAFTSRWFNSIQFPGQSWTKLEPFAHSQDEIQRALADVTISLDAADWFDIKEPIHNVIRVDMPPKTRQQYREMEKEMFLELNGEGIEAPNAAAKTVKCLQIASGAVYTDDAGSWSELHDAKLQALDSILTEAAGAPVLVAYHWKHDLARLLKAFPKGRHLDQDPQTLRDWNAGKIPVLFAHPASAGHGLNMQDGGNILVFFSHWWDLEQYQQIIERIGPTRQIQAGHKRPVFIHHIIAADTMDEMVMERRNSKRTVQDILLDAMKKRGIA
ncbi:DEAD/DEAH box helicase [Escherichia coli]|uniref:SNF2-related protein n=1 Tax=Escherichia coli TaxID=562 RepID=UPI001FF5B241|nr:DEAD/DEAH box helicase [Escherichia coli]MCJ8695571.1 DEAD/DEAH box helicase [Escherichia coli]